ncbi:MAG: hypothetical protein F9K32_09890 [Desulfobulbaceae bacterium]|nr:MAG: hypothetical protein F9K32_09890 [Desulfobulbaceae bacterium]
MKAQTTLICLFIALVVNTTMIAPTVSLSAGLFSAVERIAARRALQHKSAAVAEKKAVAKAAEKKAVRVADKKASKVALAEARAKSSWAASKKRKGLISMAERSGSAFRYNDLRNKQLPVTRMGSDRKVYRYYPSVGKARSDLRKGIPAGRHLTASGPGRIGRPIEGATAQERYGLAYRPKARVTVTVPNDSLVKKGKVIGGQPGYGQIVPQRRTPPSQVGDLHIIP